MTQQNALSLKVCLILFVILSVFVVSGCNKKVSQYELEIEVWGVFDDSNKYDELFLAYYDAHPHVNSVSYRKFTIQEYREELLNALAAGNGPDIFMIHNTWLPDFEDKIVPVSPAIIDEQLFRESLVDVAYQDATSDGEIFAVPLSVDSLALYYNKDIFNAAGITKPPATWTEFNDVVKRLTRIDENGNITQSAAALGTAENINRSVDLLTVMMLQGGTQMSNGRLATFAESQTIAGDVRLPGKDALSYYTSFARGSSPLYTWNAGQHYSLDAFFDGSTAMTLNYSYHYDTIQAKNAKLNFAVAPLPQIDSADLAAQVNYANYWMFVVAKNKEVPTGNVREGHVAVTNDMRIHESWQLLKALAFAHPEGMPISNAVDGTAFILPLPFDLTEKYLTTTKKPAARRDLIEQQLDDVALAPFAQGNLIAQSWYHPNAEAVERILAEMITSVNTGALTLEDALNVASRRATQLMQ